TSLVGGELSGQALIVSQSTNQVGLGTRFDHLELVVADVILLQFFNFFVDGGGNFPGRMPGKRESVKGEEVGILDAGKASESGGKRCNLLVAHQRPVKARSAALRHQIGDRVKHGV